jgi:hypothetical protein
MCATSPQFGEQVSVPPIGHCRHLFGGAGGDALTRGFKVLFNGAGCCSKKNGAG